MLGLLNIAAIEVYQRTEGGKTHPDPPDRLMHFVDEHLDPESSANETDPLDYARHLAIAALQPHFDQAGLELPPDKVFDSAHDYLSELMFTLKRHRTR